MNLELLPVCDLDDRGNTDDDWDYGDDTDDGTISLRHEQILRGWLVSETGSKIPLEITCRNCGDNDLLGDQDEEESKSLDSNKYI
jgi:hypothetical protein